MTSPSKQRRYSHPSLLDGFKLDPNPSWLQKQPESQPSGGLPAVKEEENTTTEFSSGGPGADGAQQGAAHANDEQGSPPQQENGEQGPQPQQANNRSTRAPLRARVRRICDKVKKLGEYIKEKTTRPVVPHH